MAYCPQNEWWLSLLEMHDCLMSSKCMINVFPRNAWLNTCSCNAWWMPVHWMHDGFLSSECILTILSLECMMTACPQNIWWLYNGLCDGICHIPFWGQYFKCLMHKAVMSGDSPFGRCILKCCTLVSYYWWLSPFGRCILKCWPLLSSLQLLSKGRDCCWMDLLLWTCLPLFIYSIREIFTSLGRVGKG